MSTNLFDFTPTPGTSISGIEDDPYYGDKGKSYDLTKQEVCTNASHNPPMFISIPQGKIYRHVCPGCGVNFILRPPSIVF